MRRCLRCDAENADGRRFCTGCGGELEDAVAMADDDTLIMRLVTGESAPRPREAVGRAYLWLLDPSGQQVERAAELPGAEPVVIGRRPDVTVALPSNTVSRRHAQIEHQDGEYFLSDLGSTNGTLLNGEPVIGTERLGDRDEIAIGIYKLIFRSL